MRDDRGDHRRSDNDCEHAGENGDDHRLGELSIDQCPRRSAEGTPDRDVAPLPLSADEEEVRHVRAGDDEQHAHRAEQDPKRAFERPEQLLLQGHDARNKPLDDLGVGSRAAVLLRQAACDPLELGD